MADAIISAVLEKLGSLMAQEIEQEVRLVTGVNKEVKTLTNNLRAIRVVLVDAEQRQFKEQRVRDWLDQLKDVVYDMDDVLDEWNTARLKLQMEEVVDNSVVALMKKVCSSLFASPCLYFKQVGLRHDIAVKIKDINENLDQIANTKNMFSFHVNEVKSVEKPLRVQSTSIIDESEICGRANEKNTLISKLLCENSAQQKNLHIISIVGMGGIGKTTLAQLAFNNEEVKKDFDKIIWVCVSDHFDEFRVARAIIGDMTFNSTELEPVMQSVRESITGKKFLLVLDDVWNEEYCKWEPFYNCLKNGLYGSKILITTRKEIVARVMGSTDIIPIMQLADEECWSLFRQLAFFDRSNEECEKLEKIGRKIAGKCKGLPLVAKLMGSLLRSKKSEIEWQRILDSELWKLEEMEKGLLPALLLSYNELPYVIKQCFSYCAVFPKDYEIDKDDLVRLWMAQGYLTVEQDEEMELIGEKYFDILATRSFFQEFMKDDEGNIIGCNKMHDMVHEFAQFLRKNECFSCQISSSDEESVTKSFAENVHHLMLRSSEEKPSFPLSIFKVKKLHSLIIKYAMLESEIVKKICCELSCLRTFHMSAWYTVDITEIPREVGKLIYLRYLNLSYQNIPVLPDTLCELYNLQSLDVTSCAHLKELPQGIGKLINLRQLLNDGTRALRWMPAGIGRLTSLRTLNKLVVGGGSQGCSLETLKSLNLLRGACGIEGLGNVLLDEAERSQLEKNKNLWLLRLDFDGGGDEEEEEGRKKDEEVLRALQPTPSLKTLQISGYRGNNFLSWKWMMSLTNLTSLYLRLCKNCEHLPALGKLPSLEELHIYGLKSVRRVGNEVLGIESDDTSSSSSVIAFPKLISLFFSYMYELEEWDFEITRCGGEIMPRLSSLEIHSCPKLKALPDYILRIETPETLQISGCSILQERYKKERRDDWLKISHIPKIHIY